MSGAFRVVLRRINGGRCSCCGAPFNASTGPTGTVNEVEHLPYCGVGRVIQFAAAPRRSSFEFLPADDTPQGRRTA